MSVKTVSYQASKAEDMKSLVETTCEGCQDEFNIEGWKDEAAALAATAIWAAKHKCQIKS
jgi:hypothetical protein